MAQRIQRFAPGQAAKVLGILYAIMGVIFMPFFLLGALLGVDEFPIGFALALPVVYGLLGAIFVAIGCVLYNLVARVVGGIEVELVPGPVSKVQS